jgi:hypothetical protein
MAAADTLPDTGQVMQGRKTGEFFIFLDNLSNIKPYFL